MKHIYLVVFSMLFVYVANAKVWRINNNAGVIADFSSAGAAVSSTAVLDGDTLYFEASATSYGDLTMVKRLVYIGTGYFLTGSNSNTGLQANPDPSVLGSAILDSAGSGSSFIGLTVGIRMGPNANAAGTDDITITRCQLTYFGNYYSAAAGKIMSNWNVNKCYITGSFGDAAHTFQNFTIRNNIFLSWMNMENAGCSGNVVRNNIFRNATHVYNAYFANNILSNNNDLNFTNTVLKNNLVIGQPAAFSAYQGTNNNSWNYTDAQLFQGLTDNSTDGQWRLQDDSPAKNGGLTVGTVTTPDCGAFGGPDPYILSGIPNIPTIYSLSVPASVPSGSSTMNITFSTRNNN